jgi:hypothetical protein
MERAEIHPMRILIMVISLLLVGITTGHTDPPQLPRGKGEQCVAPTDVMRRDHMEFLLHQRDKTVRQGIRTEQYSLAGCVDCHVQTNSNGEFIPVDAPEQFCQACHNYASVKLDCFECHATTPDENHSAWQIKSSDSGMLSNYTHPVRIWKSNFSQIAQ